MVLLIRHLDRSRYEPWITFAVDSPSPMLGEFEALGCRVVRLGRRLIRRSAPPAAPGALGVGNLSPAVSERLRAMGYLR